MADPTRRHLLRILEDSPDPLDVKTLAHHLGLHPNTVRSHLDLLSQARLVTRSAEGREMPGRPRMLYEIAPAESHSPESEGYRLLAEVLASFMEANLDQPSASAEEAGRVWGRHLVGRPQPFERPNSSVATDQIVTALDELGFAPERHNSDVGTILQLHDCPFREVAQARANVVCSVHLGILRGMAEELDGSLVVDYLQPFVGPSLCIAGLSATV